MLFFRWFKHTFFISKKIVCHFPFFSRSTIFSPVQVSVLKFPLKTRLCYSFWTFLKVMETESPAVIAPEARTWTPRTERGRWKEQRFMLFHLLNKYEQRRRHHHQAMFTDLLALALRSYLKTMFSSTTRYKVVKRTYFFAALLAHSLTSIALLMDCWQTEPEWWSRKMSWRRNFN